MRIGTTVLYVLSASDVAAINNRRTTQESISSRMARNPPEWPSGAVAHVGDAVKEGDTLPMLVTRETPSGQMISGQVFLNGNDTYWVAACQLVTDEPPTPGQAMTKDDQMSFAARPQRGETAAPRQDRLSSR